MEKSDKIVLVLSFLDTFNYEAASEIPADILNHATHSLHWGKTGTVELGFIEWKKISSWGRKLSKAVERRKDLQRRLEDRRGQVILIYIFIFPHTYGQI